MNIKVYPFYAKLGEPGKKNIIELLLAEIQCKNLLNVPWQNKNQQRIYAAVIVYADSLCLFATHINTVLSYIYD